MAEVAARVVARSTNCRRRLDLCMAGKIELVRLMGIDKQIANPEKGVYFLGLAGWIKIGYGDEKRPLDAISRHPEAEILGFSVCGNVEKMEKNIHRKFRHLRGEGEWFRDTIELRDFIHSVSGQAILTEIKYCSGYFSNQIAQVFK